MKALHTVGSVKWTPADSGLPELEVVINVG